LFFRVLVFTQVLGVGVPYTTPDTPRKKKTHILFYHIVPCCLVCTVRNLYVLLKTTYYMWYQTLIPEWKLILWNTVFYLMLTAVITNCVKVLICVFCTHLGYPKLVINWLYVHAVRASYYKTSDIKNLILSTNICCMIFS